MVSTILVARRRPRTAERVSMAVLAWWTSGWMRQLDRTAHDLSSSDVDFAAKTEQASSKSIVGGETDDIPFSSPPFWALKAYRITPYRVSTSVFLAGLVPSRIRARAQQMTRHLKCSYVWMRWCPRHQKSQSASRKWTPAVNGTLDSAKLVT